MARTITARIWEIADALTADRAIPARRADVVARCVAEDINKATANTQYGHWKRKRFAKGSVSTPSSILVEEPSVQMRPDRDWSQLLRRGFVYVGDFKMEEDGKPVLDEIPPSLPGVYAIVRDQSVVYIGISNRTLKARMNDYRRGHKGQRTSSRINARLREELTQGVRLRLLCATPETSTWNGLPVNTAAGLELGLISALKPEWNMQGCG